MDWLIDYSECLAGDHGQWWQRRAEQHAEEIAAGEKRGKWWTWRDVRLAESQPPVSVLPEVQR